MVIKHRLKKVESAGWPHLVISLKAHIDRYTKSSQDLNERGFPEATTLIT